MFLKNDLERGKVEVKREERRECVQESYRPNYFL